MTVLMAGVRPETSERILPSRLAMWLREPSAMRISMTTGYGVKSRPTVPSGFQAQFHQVGLLISMDTGFGLSPGAGRGSMTRLGDTHHFTMVAGSTPAAIGDGLRAQSMCARSTRQL